MSIESIIEQATKTMEAWAADASHGYDQSRRWGPDYDCSSAVISAWELAGVPVKSKGATYTGNMYSVFLQCGFEDVTAGIDFASGVGLQRGDVLLNHVNHTAMYVGGNKTVEASINENGTTTGGMTGDQTGREFLLRGYRDYPWDAVLRYTGKAVDAAGGNQSDAESGNKAPTYFYSVKLPLLKIGMQSLAVGTLCYILSGLGYYKGETTILMTEKLVEALMDFQRDNALEVDGECGGMSWAKLIGV